MAWWLQGDLQPFAHFRSGMGRSPGGSVGAAAAGAAQPPCGRSPAALRAQPSRPAGGWAAPGSGSLQGLG